MRVSQGGIHRGASPCGICYNCNLEHYFPVVSKYSPELTLLQSGQVSFEWGGGGGGGGQPEFLSATQ